MKILLPLFIVLCWSPLKTLANNFTNEHQVAERLLKELYKVNVDQNFPRPRLEISNSQKYGGAAYLPESNIIVLENKAYQVCQSFGPDFLHALAFILGHELTHFYQSKYLGTKHATQFLAAYSQDYPGSTQQEKVADIHGAFTAYLAGYQPQRVLGELFDRLYASYGITNQLVGIYPTLDERRKTAKETWKIAEELIQIFESAQYLQALGEYQLAKTSYRYIATYYHGPEILNNLGINCVLEAINLLSISSDYYLYPIEVDVDGRLFHAIVRGSQAPQSPQAGTLPRPPLVVDADQYLYKYRLLTEAKAHFEQILSSNPSYLPAHLNMLCVLTVMEEYEQAVAYYRIRELENLDIPKEFRQKSQLVYATALIRTNSDSNKHLGRKILLELTNSQLPTVAYLSGHNLQILDCGKIENFLPEPPKASSLPFDPAGRIDDVRINRYQDKLGKWLDDNKTVSLFIERHIHSTVVNYYQKEGKSITIQRIFKPTGIQLSQDKIAFKKQFIPTTYGFFLPIKEKRLVLKIDNRYRLVEWAKFYR